jgi:hypothetical protein
VTGIQSRIIRIEKSRPSRGSLEWLTTDELEELERVLCAAIVSAPESTAEQRADAQSTVEKIDKERDAREARGLSRYLQGVPDEARMARAMTDFFNGLQSGAQQ